MISTALIGFGGLAYADDDPTSPAPPPSSETTDPPPPTETSTPTSEPVEEPAPPKDDEEPADPPANETPELAPPSVSTASACDAGIGFVEVHITNPNDVEETYTVGLGEQTAEVAVAAGATEVVGFEDVPGGEHDVLISRGDEVVAESVASVDRCNEVGPVDDPLQVFVRCEDGRGLVTIRVFNTEGESRTYTVSIDDLQMPGDIELGANEYAVVIDEVEAPDGTYSVRVVAEGIDHTETVKVACAPAPPTSTTPPVAQPRPAPASNNDGLASTGAAVGGMALLAVLALAAGGGLVIASRRRRNPQPDSTD